MTFEKYDIVINGGSFGAVSAAMQAARENPGAKILLIEPTDWLGGQATSQGVSAIDYPWQEPARSLVKNYPEKYLPKDFLAFIHKLKNKNIEVGFGYGGENCGWVSRDCFDPRSGAFILEEMISKYSNITLKKLSVVKKVHTISINDIYGQGLIIEKVEIITRKPVNGYIPFTKFLSEEIYDWYSTKDSNIFSKEIIIIESVNSQKGLIVIDASEFGDVIVLSGAKYTIGREIEREEILEDGILPEMDEACTQSFVFCFCITGSQNPVREDNLKNIFLDFNEYYNEQVKKYFSFGKNSWGRIWTYRRLKRQNEDDAESGIANIQDISMQNWYPGNDYPYGSLFKTKAEITDELYDWYGGIWGHRLAEAEKHALAWHFYFKEKKTVPFEIFFLKGEAKDNLMGTGTGLSKMPYFRDTRRIIGLNNFRIVEKYYNTNKKTSERFFDSVGIGQYAADIHPINGHLNGVTPSIEKPNPFYIPYRALGSVNVRNLLAGGKNYSTSYITNSAYRVHPIEWSAGSATGTAAALMAKYELFNYDLLQENNLKLLQSVIKKNAPVSWYEYDKNT